MKLGLVVFTNDSGLGAQTRRLTYMLRPYRLLAIDSSSFSKNKQSHFEWYKDFSGYRVYGFPNNREYSIFMQGLTHVLICENPLNFAMLKMAQMMRVKVFIQSNYEFCDHLVNKNLELPHKFLMPSYWKIDEMKSLFGDDKVEYLPPPTDPAEFADVRRENMNRDVDVPKLLHITGTLAAQDRNGTLDLLKALPFVKGNFQLVIRSQHELPPEYMVDDKRVSYAIGNVAENCELYRGFDGCVIPRRYGGLSLTTNEALMGGLPVIMPAISPNKELLPKEWTVEAKLKGQFRTRSMIDIYEVEPVTLAKKIDWFLQQDLLNLKIQAFDLGYNNFAPSVLLDKYNALWSQQ